MRTAMDREKEEYSVLKRVSEFNRLWSDLANSYNAYAAHYDLSYSKLQVISDIYNRGAKTQKEIADHSRLPKQTINAVINGFAESGYITFTENPADKRSKLILLTKSVEKYAQDIAATLRVSEFSAMNELTEQEQKTMLMLMRRYIEGCVEFLNESIKE